MTALHQVRSAEFPFQDHTCIVWSDSKASAERILKFHSQEVGFDPPESVM